MTDAKRLGAEDERSSAERVDSGRSTSRPRGPAGRPIAIHGDESAIVHSPAHNLEPTSLHLATSAVEGVGRGQRRSRVESAGLDDAASSGCDGAFRQRSLLDRRNHRP
jgi:hypothetical protein